MAMEAEFEAAIEDGRPFLFALGCLFAAWREIGKHSAGRLILANYALALGLLIPMATLQFQQAAGFLSSAEGMPSGILSAGDGPNLYLIWSQNSAIPILLITWLVLGMAHLCLAWMLVEGDWPRIVKCSTLIGAAMITLSLFMGVLMLDVLSLRTQVAELMIEFVAMISMSRWHISVFSDTSREFPTW
ncbi:hypothetical protein [Sphingomonas sp. PP-F2F-A104-K0414]|uniref:hypothetical protein n=1 Tax=Sphingomonas sp. PP-F2F-A104-K0414 TaxID=2135661 RepID=UPI0014048E46|nr:hypothetical protein [Sphingomonas sp. PP-F2F-A104-K0414]